VVAPSDDRPAYFDLIPRSLAFRFALWPPPVPRAPDRGAPAAGESPPPTAAGPPRPPPAAGVEPAPAGAILPPAAGAAAGAPPPPLPAAGTVAAGEPPPPAAGAALPPAGEPPPAAGGWRWWGTSTAAGCWSCTPACRSSACPASGRGRASAFSATALGVGGARIMSVAAVIATMESLQGKLTADVTAQRRSLSVAAYREFDTTSSRAQNMLGRVQGCGGITSAPLSSWLP
jgi:hypothetical protein